MSLGLYKWPQGRIIRYLAGGVGLSYVSYGAYRLYSKLGDKHLSFVPEKWRGLLSLGVLGSVLVLLAGALAIYALVFANARVADYLIAVDAEMRKVYWPKIKPWFAWSSELWGSTYVVIIVVVILSVFLYVVDRGFTPLHKWIFLK